MLVFRIRNSTVLLGNNPAEQEDDTEVRRPCFTPLCVFIAIGMLLLVPVLLFLIPELVGKYVVVYCPFSVFKTDSEIKGEAF